MVRRGRVLLGSCGAVVSALLSLLGCSDGAPDSGGGSPPPAAADCAAGELRLPDGRCQPPGLPLDMACPPGERALDGERCEPAGVPAAACAAGRFEPDGRGGCAPILPEGRCPSGQMAVPGDRACRDVSPCGEGAWGNIPVDGTTVYVDQQYAGGASDGSLGRPWRTVREGVRAASPGAIVAVAEGRYREDVVIFGKPVRLWGRCPALTRIVGTGPRPGAITITRDGASGAEVRGLAVTGPTTGIYVQGARSVVIENVWVHEVAHFGVNAVERAGVTLRGVLVEQNGDMGVYVLSSEATVEASVVRATELDRFGRLGWGIAVRDDPSIGAGGRLSLTTSLIEENHDTGVLISGSEATIEASVVRATQPDGAGQFGRGINVRTGVETGAGGKLSLKSSLVEENHNVGVFTYGSEATVEATVVRATRATPRGEGGRGIAVQPSLETGVRGKLSLRSSLIAENRDAGVFIAGSEASVEGTVVRATQPSATGEFGRGIGVQVNPETRESAKFSLASSLVEENHDVGVFIAGSEASVEGTVVRATQPSAAGQFGRGVVVQTDPAVGVVAKLRLTASLVEENHDVGVFLSGAEATIDAMVVRATRRTSPGQEFGDGIMVMDALGPGRVAISATESTGNARAGVMFVGSAGELSFVRSRGNRFGLVLQPGDHQAQPTLGQNNFFEGNAERDRVTGGDLPVPDAVPPLP